MKFKIEYGLGGGFNDVRTEIMNFKSEKEAVDAAYQMAIEVYQEYEGLHGLRTIEDIMDEEGVDEEEAEEIYREERENWLDYGAEPVAESKLKKTAKEIKDKKVDKN
jgi:Mg2+/Co2+ transporter CorC